MVLGDSLPEFRELRMFAMEAIPRILQEEGGTIAKTELHSRLKELFARAGGGWPKELDGVGRSGCTRGTNAIAWALATLTSQMVTEPCLGSDMVRLRRGAQPRGSGASTPKTRPCRSSDHNTRMEALVRARARQAMGRAAGANLPFDDGFVEDSVLAVRKAGYRCEISRRPFDIDYRTMGAGGTHYAPSPDRIVPARGYVRGNVRWVLWCLNRGKGEMSADDYLEVCRLVANYNAEAMGPSGAAPETVREDEPVGTSNGTPPEGYTIQQVAAFKAHVTMLRKSLSVLTGSARARALEKLARQEARLATALSTDRADLN